MLVSVIVLNYNGAHLLPDCLRSLQGQTHSPLELLVVDNDSADDSRRVAEAHGVPFHPMGWNAGFSAANNRGAELARGSLLFFVNMDMRFDADCVARLAARFDADGDLFAADPLQYDWTGSRIVHGRTVLRRASLLRSVFPGLRIDYLAPPGQDDRVPWGCGGSLMVRRDRFLELGGFDPAFFLDFEDADLCWRAWRRRWATRFEPEAVLWHRVAATDEGRSPGRPQSPAGWRRMLSSRKNAQRFALKSFEPWRAAMVPAMFALKALRETVAGSPTAAGLTLRSVALSARELGEILAQRRDLDRSGVASPRELVARFLSLSADGSEF